MHDVDKGHQTMPKKRRYGNIKDSKQQGLRPAPTISAI